MRSLLLFLSLSLSHTLPKNRLAMKFKMKVMQQLNSKVMLELSLSLAMLAIGALSCAFSLSLSIYLFVAPKKTSRRANMLLSSRDIRVDLFCFLRYRAPKSMLQSLPTCSCSAWPCLPIHILLYSPCHL